MPTDPNLSGAERALVEAVRAHHNDIQTPAQKQCDTCCGPICAALSAFLAERAVPRAIRADTGYLLFHCNDLLKSCPGGNHFHTGESLNLPTGGAPAEPGGAGHGVGGGGVEDTIHKLHALGDTGSNLVVASPMRGEVPVENRDSGPLPLRCNQPDIRGEECELPRGHADSFAHRGISKDEMTAMLEDAESTGGKLRARVEKLEGALREIRDDPHCAYDHPQNGTGQYGIGVTDGHRCASMKAAALLRGGKDA